MKSSDQDLIDQTLRVHKKRSSRRTTKGYEQAAFALVDRAQEAARVVEEQFRHDEQTDQYGQIPLEKDDDVYRCMFENWNSLRIYTGQQKVAKIDHLRKRYNVDIILGCETQCDWRHADSDSQFKNLFGLGKAKKVCVGHNVAGVRKTTVRDQKG